MIRLENIGKQNGKQIVFIEASAALQKGEKVGLVGPNGAGKTTLFRMITGQEQPDEGQVQVDRGVTIGYFSQDVGDMAGRSAVAEVMDGAGPASALMAEMAELEAAMADPDQADEMDEIIARYGEAQGRFEELDGYALDGRAREVLDGLGFSQEMMDGDVGALSGGWKMRVALARILLMRPDALLLDEPSNHLDLESLIWLEDFLKGYDGALLDDLARPRVHEPHRQQDRRDRCRFAHRLFRQLRILPAAAGDRRQAAAGAVRAPAGDAGQGDRLHRALQGARLACRAGAEPGEEARQDRPGRAAQAPPDTVNFEFRPAPRCGEDVVTLKNVHKGYGSRTIYDGLDFQVRRSERWCIMGVNGAGKSTLLKLVAGASEPDKGTVARGPSVKMGYFAQHAMDLLDGERTVFQTLEDAFPQAGQAPLRALAGCFGFSGDEIEKKCRVLSGGEKARLVMALLLFDPPNFLVLDEPTNHLDIATKEMLIEALSQYEGTMLFVSHDRHFLAALSNRVLELTPEGIHTYGGGYTEYVESTGQEAPGLRS